MKVRLLHAEELPPGLVRGVLEGLPPPWTAGGTVELSIRLGDFYDRPRAQHDAASLLEAVPAPPRGESHVLLTALDLFVPALTYVFGLSHLGGFRSVLSFARLKPPLPEPEAAQVLARRLDVEVAHELGHSAGLVHCPVPDCPMHRSLWPETIDLKNAVYCPACRQALDGLVG